ncbi:MAG TPA: BTAD domain-containing putative transcriptional regulator [Trebonia sp.]
MRFRILGPLEVLSPGGWTAISAAKWRSLLAVLLLRNGQLVPTESLIDELWGDSPPGTANNLVSIYVHRLKKVIGDTEGRMLVYRAPGYMLRIAPEDLDIRHFEGLAAEGVSALAAGQPAPAAELLGRALGLWRGPLLADVPPSPLIAAHADRTAEQWLTTTELRVEADLACGRAAQVIPELRGLVTVHPLREHLWALLVRALEEAGRRAQALEVYAQARQVISEELGVDPGAELQRLYAELLAADVPSPAARSRRARKPPDASAGAPGMVTAARPDSEASQPPAAGDAAAGYAGQREPGAEAPGSIAIGTLDESALPGAAEPADQEARLPDAAAEARGGVPGGLRPAQLPADIGDFTGRGAHVESLSALLIAGNAASNPGAVRIAVVNGAGGLGKTTLAVHAAHQVSAQFPDGQLYVDLLGASSLASPPGEVLARFLRDLGIEGDKIPARDEERAALYRTALTGRRMLILLDNAKDAAQVRPLLPGSSSCAVLVTTRSRMSALASTRFLDLNVLEDTEALALFTRIVGEERAAAEPDATAEVLVACAGLPLAIRICAARLAARRQWRIAALAERLRDQHRRLDELKTGDLAVRASFRVSYDSLQAGPDGVDPRRAFRLLGLWEGSSISLAAAAALIGESGQDTADALETLVDGNLLESPDLDWYRFHDLLRVYATERAQAEEPPAARADAVRRLLRWYLDTAEAVANTVSPRRYQVPREAAADGRSPGLFGGLEDALAWYDGEHANVVAATRQAAAAGLDEIAWRLPPTLFPVFNRRSNWVDCVTAHRIAAERAGAAGERLGEAWALNQLGFALAKLRDREAFAHLEQALALRQELGDTQGEVQTSLSLGEAYLNLDGPGTAALAAMRGAVNLLRPTGPSPLLAAAVNNLGEVHYGLGDLESAAECYAESCDIYRETGGYGLGHALHNLGRVYLALHRVDDARLCLKEAVSAHRESGDLVGEAVAVKHLGYVHAATGDVAAARAAWASALAIFEQFGETVEAADVIAALAAAPAAPGGPPPGQA